ncbi:hypothetical protein [Pectobacterium parvum]|uniref:hypothetical protein n=1 Tax=Pectobacterium parvum TaxID=2778550 RepID=UPI000DCF8B49|nr:hypothetical protein [Pectobacterium parvum]
MAKKSIVYGVRVRTAQDGVFIYKKPVPGMSKNHVFNEVNSQLMAVLEVKYLGWYDITLTAYSPTDYFFELTSKKSGNTYTFESGDFGWGHLNYQFQQDVDEMVEIMDSDY